MNGERVFDCPGCGNTMRFSRCVPRLGILPELRIFSCRACGVVVSETGLDRGAIGAGGAAALLLRSA